MVGGILTNDLQRPSGASSYHVGVTRSARLPLVLAVGLLLSACASDGVPVRRSGPPADVNLRASPQPAGDTDPGLERYERLVANAISARIPAFRHPGAEEPFHVFRNPDEYRARPVFLVDRMRDDWLEVYLPVRPNGTTGWIRGRDVKLRTNPYRIEIDLGRNLLQVLEKGEVTVRETVTAGTGGTPTPTGLFYTTILVEYADPSGAYGPYAFGLSAFSEVLFSFGGGNGQVAIHGTNAPWALGQDVSHGCVRMRNPAIRRLAGFLPLGTPVRITP
jgi:lipoprotein-anchoring transpeptidase ErfK/SrfK